MRNNTERFNEKLKYDEDTGCHIWVASKDRDGYGWFRLNKVMRYAHRVAWEWTFGEIPVDTLVLHKCDTPSCVNPDHLFLGTHQDNMDDMANKGRRNGGRSKENICKRGHDITPGHGGRWPSGNCRACSYERV